MNDLTLFSYIALTLTVTGSDVVYRCVNSGSSVSFDGDQFLPQEALNITFPDQTGDMADSDMCTVEGLAISGTLLTGLANNARYPRIEVSIDELTVDGDDITQRSIYKGLVYQSVPGSGGKYLGLNCRDFKYYTDITAGIVCSEQCMVGHFGDKICAKALVEVSVKVQDVDGLNITMESVPASEDKLFNSGTIALDGITLKVRYWDSGNTFELSTPAPASWEGRNVTLTSGCDRTLNSCRQVHNNEANFFGLGYSMVDYNAYFESN